MIVADANLEASAEYGYRAYRNSRRRLGPLSWTNRATFDFAEVMCAAQGAAPSSDRRIAVCSGAGTTCDEAN